LTRVYKWFIIVSKIETFSDKQEIKMIDHSLIISNSQSFETRKENGITVFKAEGDIVQVLENFGFNHQQFLNCQSGKKEFGNLYYNYQENTDSGLFIHHNPTNNTWICQLVIEGNYNNFI
jgi:hypothetical protein